MALRWILGLLLAATLSGCFEGSSGSSAAASTAGTSGVSSTSGAVSGSITSTSTAPPPSVAPIILSGVPAASVIVGSAYSFTPTVASATGVVTFAVSGLPAWATFDSSTGTLSGTPSTAAVGTTGDITITATDGTDTGSVGPFVIRIDSETPAPTPVPTPTPTPTPTPAPVAPPVISGSPATAVTSGQSYVFQPAASDAAGNPLTFAIINCPAWAVFSTASGQLTGTPTAAQAGAYTSISIRVTDGTLSAALPPFTIAVTAAAPDMPVIGGTPAASVVGGHPYSFQPTASDPAGKALVFSIKNPPVWGSFSTATGKLSGTPAATQVGSYAGIVITADNGTQMTSLPAFAIQVTAASAPDSPSISGTPGTTVTAGQPYGFTPTASDPEAKSLTFSIANRPTWATFNTANGSLSGTPTSAQAGSYPGIGITVTNGTASASLPVFGITVATPAPPASPTISGSPATTVMAGTAYSFLPTHTDPSGGTLVFGITNAPSWATFNTATGQLSGTPSASAVGTTSGITISVSDGTTSATLPAFSVTVSQAPATNGSATLSWTAPTTNTDGTPLTDLAGYRIYYGNSAGSMAQTVQITDPTEVTYAVSGLSSGTWYFEVMAYNSANVDSSAAGAVSKTIN